MPSYNRIAISLLAVNVAVTFAAPNNELEGRGQELQGRESRYAIVEAREPLYGYGNWRNNAKRSSIEAREPRRSHLKNRKKSEDSPSPTTTAEQETPSSTRRELEEKRFERRLVKGAIDKLDKLDNLKSNLKAATEGPLAPAGYGRALDETVEFDAREYWVDKLD